MIEHERVDARPLCGTPFGEKVRLRRRFIPFFICVRLHEVIQGKQVLHNTKGFLQIIAKFLYLIRGFLDMLRIKCCLFVFFFFVSSTVDCSIGVFSSLN